MILDALIADAMVCAGNDIHGVVHNFEFWETDGGRACPIGWDHCSQPVFRHKITGEYDYGEVGGPGHADCKKNCPYGFVRAPGFDERSPRGYPQEEAQ